MQHDMIGLRCFFRGRIVSVSLDDIAGVRTDPSPPISPSREPRAYFAGLFFHSEHVVVGREVVHQDSYFLILHSERERALLRGSFAPMFLIFEAVYSSCSRSFSCTRNARISRGKSCGTS
jgi:hypothetical protein